MGARVNVFNRRKVGGELMGDLEVHSAELTATDVTAEEVPGLSTSSRFSRWPPGSRAA